MENPDLEKCKNDAEMLNIDFDEYLDAYFELPLFSEEKLEAAANLVRIVSNTISDMALKESIAKEKGKGLEKEIIQKESDLQKVETKCKRIFESVDDGLFELTFEGDIFLMNKAGKEILGIPLGDSIDQKYNIKRFLLDPNKFLIDEVIRKGRVKEKVIKMKRYDGKVVYIEVSLRVVYQNDNNKMIEGIFRDVTERIVMQRKLQYSEARYRDLFHNAYDMIYVVDMDGNFIDGNKMLLENLEVSNEEFKRLNLKDVLDEQQYEKSEKMLQEKLSGDKEKTSYELKFKDKRGELHDLDIHTRLLHKNNKAIGVQGIIRDVTKRNNLLKNFRSILDMSTTGVCITNKNGDFLYMNERLAKMFNYKKSDLEKINIINLYKNPEIRKRVLNLLDRNNYLESYIIEAQDQYKRDFLIELKAKKIKYHDEICYLSMMRDITRRKVVLEIAQRVLCKEYPDSYKKLEDILNVLSKRFRIFQQYIFAKDNKFKLIELSGIKDAKILNEIINLDIFNPNEKKVICLNDIPEKFKKFSLEIKQFVKDNMIQSLILIPLRIQKKVIGKYVVFSRENSKLSERELDYLRMVGFLITVCLKEVKDFEEIFDEITNFEGINSQEKRAGFNFKNKDNVGDELKIDSNVTETS